MLGLEVVAPFAVKGIGAGMRKGMGSVAEKMRRFATERPMSTVEAVTKIGQSKRGVWEFFDWDRAARKELKKLGFDKGEAQAVLAQLEGRKGAARQHLLERQFAGKEVSKAWKRNMGRVSGVPYGEWVPKEKVVQAVSKRRLEERHYRQLYRRNLRNAHGVKGEGAEKVMQSQMERLYGVKGASWEELTEESVANMIQAMVGGWKGNRAIKALVAPGGNAWLPWIAPMRVVFGAGEAVLGTKSRIFDRLVEANGAKNMYAFQWAEMFERTLVDEGFGKIEKKTLGGWKFTPNELYSDANTEAAQRVLGTMDDIMETGRKDKAALGEARAAVQRILKETEAQSPVVGRLVRLVWGFNDAMYKDYITRKPGRVLARLKGSEKGFAALGRFMQQQGMLLDQTFSSANMVDMATKAQRAKDFIKELRGAVDETWFKGSEAQRLDRAARFKKELGGNNWPMYLEAYTPRIYRKGAMLDQAIGHRLGRKEGVPHAFFAKERKVPGMAPFEREGFAGTVQARIRAQANDLLLYDTIAEISEYAARLSGHWRLHTDRLIGVVLHRPSIIDDWVARNVLGRMPFVKSGSWDANRVYQLGQTINNITYQGFLGLKPFSVIRNMVQPLLTVPTDLGGARSYVHLLDGMNKAMETSHRRYMQEIGAITEFMPELHGGPLLYRHGNRMLGMEEMTRQRIRDVALWGFQMSDRWNRYVTGGAAVSKWDWAMSVADGDVDLFMKKIKAGNRRSWIRDEIEGYLRRGLTEDAKRVFVKDVVADTQFLYSALDAPELMRVGGGIGRTMTIFQSWWMNYGSLIGKWMRGAPIEQRAENMFNMVFSAALAEQLLEVYAGRESAVATVLAGPMPDRLPTPPMWELMFNTLALVKNTVQSTLDWDNLETTERNLIRVLKGAGSFAPGGSQIVRTIVDTSDKGFEGLLPSILRYKKDPMYEPLWGAKPKPARTFRDLGRLIQRPTGSGSDQP